MRSVRLGLLALFLATVPAGGASAAIGVWEDGEANLFIGNLGQWWASEISRAANGWNRETNFTFDIQGHGYGACDRYDSGVLLRGDEHVMTNGVEFNDTMCGMEDFDPNVLAVCQLIVENGFITKAGLVFNDAWNWDVFHGPIGETTIDFHRVAVHELGHFLGLDHSEGNTIMQPVVSDEIEELTEADVAAVNGMYGEDGAPAAEPAPEPAPQTTCQVSQLRASARLCKARLACQAGHAKDPSRDADGAKRDACAARAEAAFVAAWDAEVAATAPAGGCHNAEPGLAMAPLVTAASTSAINAIGDADASNALDRALRVKLLNKASALCSENFGAWKKEAMAADFDKLARGLARSRARFVAAGGKAIAKASGRGASYDGANLDLIADEIETLANDIGLATGE